MKGAIPPIATPFPSLRYDNLPKKLGQPYAQPFRIESKSPGGIFDVVPREHLECCRFPFADWLILFCRLWESGTDLRVDVSIKVRTSRRRILVKILPKRQISNFLSRFRMNEVVRI